jgi:hypothetical protein
MWNFAIPALQAIGINAGVNLLRRKPIFENAATAGVTGGVLGGFNGGGLFSSSPTAASVPSSAGAFEAAMGLPQTTSAIESAGMVFNPATGTFLNPEYYAGATTPLATYTGGEGLLSNAMGNISDTFSGLGDNLTPQNLIGVSSLLNNMSDMPRPVAASGGSVQGGTPPKFEPFVTGQVYGRKKRGNA